MSRQRPLPERITALREATDLARGRSDDQLIDQTSTLLDKVDRRLAFSGNHTVVALAGATGSGKSSTFNAIAGAPLAEPGVKRPTTSKAMAASFGGAPSSELLDWLDVPRRHEVSEVPKGLDGLVLLDLPDHDSTQAAHRMEVDRMVQLVDMLIWVVDPQKYADAALHDRYLVPMAHHSDVMLVLLNQVDTLAPEQVDNVVKDLRRLLDSEGLGKARLQPFSARTGQGVAQVRELLSGMVRDKKVAATRLSQDVDHAGGLLADSLGKEAPGAVSEARSRQLTRSLAAAAGAPVVAEAVMGATRRRGSLITGWPALSWLASLRPDPLRRLRLGALPKADRKHELEPARVQRTALPRGQGASKAQVDSAIREVSDEVAAGMPRGWAQSVRRASLTHAETLPDDLDRAVATTDLAMDRGFGYWRFIQVIQWILFACVLAGLGWLAVDFALAYFQMPPLPTRRYRSIPLQTWLVLGGVAGGLVLAGISRVLVEITARAKGRRAEQVLHRSIEQVALAKVVEPVNAELRRLQQARKAIGRAR